jgi:hypothetical protein
MSEQECCCPSPDGVVCVAIRSNKEVEDVDEPCECYCHFQAEHRFGQYEDEFYFDIDDDELDGFDDDGNRHNEMWDSPEQGPLLHWEPIRLTERDEQWVAF